MYLIVGLGNPGIAYEDSRHNIGFWAIDEVAAQCGISFSRTAHKGLIGEGFVNGQKVMLAKPQTFMNLSGECVQAIVSYYKIPLDHLAVIYDDIDLPVGELRIRGAGSAGTHNGMRSVVACLGEESFARIRVGIGARAEQHTLVSHVMGKPQGEEKELLQTACKQAADAALLLAEGKLQDAQGKYNRKARSRKEPAAQTANEEEK